MKEIIFGVTEDEIDAGHVASALGYGIHTEGDTLPDLRENLREAVACYFDESTDPVDLIRLHFVRDEVLDVSAKRLISSLRVLGYSITRQHSSHIRLITFLQVA